METSLITAKEFDDQKTVQTSNDQRLAEFVGATFSAGSVANALPAYSDHGALLDLEDGTPLDESLVSLDLTKNRAITILNTNSLGEGVEVCANPTEIRFSQDFVASEEEPGKIVVSANSGGLSYHPLETPIQLITGAANPNRRLAFSQNIGAQYPAASVVYGVFRVYTHMDGVTAYAWMDLVINGERAARMMQANTISVDYVSRPIRLTGNVITGYFDLRRNITCLYGVGPGIPLGPGETAANDPYVAYSLVKVLQINLIGFYY